MPKLFKRLESPPPSPPKASNSATSRDPEGPGSLSARARSWGAPLRGKPPIPALRVGEQLQEPEAEGPSLAWVPPPRPGPRSGLRVGVGAFRGVGGSPPEPPPRRLATNGPAPPGQKGRCGRRYLRSVRPAGASQAPARRPRAARPARGCRGDTGTPQASPPIAPASNGPRLRSVGRRPRTPGARLPAPGYGGRRGPIPAPLALRRPALCPACSPAGRAARPEPRRGG